MEDTASAFPLGEIIGIVACLVGSAIFSGSETTLTRFSLRRAAHLIDSDPGRFGILRLWLKSKRRILALLLISNNVVNILCSILAYRIAVRYLPNYAEALSVFGLTLVILVFAEITPKGIALHYAEQLVVPVLRLVWLLDKLLFPISWPLSKIPGLLMGRVSEEEEEPVVSEDEIEFHIRRGLDRAVFEEREQGELLMSAVEFSDILVKEVMIPRTDIFGLDEGTTLSEAVERVIASGHSRVPVYVDNLDRIVGLLYAKDLLGQIHRAGGEDNTTIAGLVRTDPLFVPETQKISVLLGDMRRRGLHLATVVDEFGGTAGLITLEDIIEELVGEIRDEFDPEEAMIRQLDEARWMVDARLSLSDLKDRTGIDLPDTGDYESVGGFVVAQYGRIPRKGKVIITPGLEIIVVDSEARRVKRLELRLLPPTGAPADE